MKRLMSHGQAMRSTRAFSRVIHFMATLLWVRGSGVPGFGRRERNVTLDTFHVNCYIGARSETDVLRRTAMTPSVLFVCLHGSAKSVIAAEQLRRLAAARGVPVIA